MKIAEPMASPGRRLSIGAGFWVRFYDEGGIKRVESSELIQGTVATELSSGLFVKNKPHPERD